MRRAARVDDNQSEIVKALRELGATIQTLHAVGKGCPDLLVGYNGRNFLMEVKDGAKTPSKRSLTDDQVQWHNQWKGNAVVVKSVDEAIFFLKQL